MKNLTIVAILFSISIQASFAQSKYALISAKLNKLQQQSKKANFYNSPTLLKQTNALINEIASYQKSEEAVLRKAVEDYEKTFSLLDRLNPMDAASNECKAKKINPHKQKIKDTKTLNISANSLKRDLQKLANPVETKTSSTSSICGVFNPNTGLVEWKTVWGQGLMGVYNPISKKVEWKTSSSGGVAGAYNPQTKKVEWKEETFGYSIAGVYNPRLKKVEWKSNSWGNSSVAGVYNPLTKKVEWEELHNSGVAGYFDPIKKKVVWESESMFIQNVAVVYKSADGSVPSSCSFFLPKEEEQPATSK
jgi:hypothetical protein